MNMHRRSLAKMAILLSVGVAALMIGSAADGGATSADSKALVVKLKQKNASGISGTATLIPAGPNLRVVLRLNRRVGDRPPAHIHTGPCRREPTFANPRIYNSLDYVVNGKSDTIVTDTTLKTLRARTFSINVHDPDSLRAIACGDIPRAS